MCTVAPVSYFYAFKKLFQKVLYHLVYALFRTLHNPLKTYHVITFTEADDNTLTGLNFVGTNFRGNLISRMG